MEPFYRSCTFTLTSSLDINLYGQQKWTLVFLTILKKQKLKQSKRRVSFPSGGSVCTGPQTRLQDWEVKSQVYGTTIKVQSTWIQNSPLSHDQHVVSNSRPGDHFWPMNRQHLVRVLMSIIKFALKVIFKFIFKMCYWNALIGCLIIFYPHS